MPVDLSDGDEIWRTREVLLFDLEPDQSRETTS